MPKPLVIQTEHLDQDAADWLAQRVDLVACPSDDPRFPALLADAQGLVIRTYTRVDAPLLAAAPNLKVVGRAGVGLDNVDLAAAKAAGVTVCHTPDANSTAVVEYVLALMLDATRPRLFLDAPLTPDRWKAVRNELKARRQLRQCTLGIWGLGRIGSRLARAAAALDINTIYHDLLDIPPAQRAGASPVSRQQLCQQADILTIHVDGRRANRHLVSTADFNAMKRDVVFINAARGHVVDAPALARFMRAHPAAQAMLDVHDPEPFDHTYPLLNIPNIHLAPHIASSTDLAHASMSLVVHDVYRVLCGQPPREPAAPEPL